MKRLSIVMQGNHRPETPAAIQAARACFPEAEIILATWAGQPVLPEYAQCDAVLELPDPGPLAGAGISLRNLRRQVVSTHAGLARSSGEWVIKTRSDVVLLQPAFFDEARFREIGDRIGFWQMSTADPRSNALLFHLSDLLQAGRRERLGEYWATPVPDEAARSRAVPEQWLFLHFLERRGELQLSTRDWLRPGWAAVAAHTRLVANYAYLLPLEVAELPARLRGDYSGFLKREYTGARTEAASIYMHLQKRALLAAARHWKRRLLRQS